MRNKMLKSALVLALLAVGRCLARSPQAPRTTSRRPTPRLKPPTRRPASCAINGPPRRRRWRRRRRSADAGDFDKATRVGQGSRSAGQGFDLPGHQREDPLEGFGNTVEVCYVTTRGDPHDHPPPRFPDASGRRHPVAAACRGSARRPPKQCGRLRSRALRQCAHPAHHRHPCAASAGVFSRAERQSRRRLDAGQPAASGRQEPSSIASASAPTAPTPMPSPVSSSKRPPEDSASSAALRI